METTMLHERPMLELGTVRDAVTRAVVTLRPEQSLVDAALELERAGVSSGPVVEEGAVVGVVTLRDPLKESDAPVHAATSGPWLRFEHLLARSRSTVADVMTWRPATVRADEPLAAAAVVMCYRGVNRLPVLDEDRRVVGIVTRDDVVAAVARVFQSQDEPTMALGRPRIAPD